MEFKLTKAQRLVTNAAAKDMSKPVLQNIHIRKGVVEAANGFVLCQKKVDYDGEEKILLDAKAVTSLKDSKSLGGVIFHRADDAKSTDDVSAVGETKVALEPQEGTFPDTDRIVSELSGKAVFRIALGRGVLMSLLKCLEMGEEETVQFYFYGEKSPVRITANGGGTVGVIMPMYVSSESWDVELEGESDG